MVKPRAMAKGLNWAGGFGGACAGVLLAALAWAGEATGFLPGMEDMPLAPGLAAVPDAVLAFDSPSGRIVEAFAAGTVAADRVLAFYAATLPALGWAPLGDASYAREGERLDLDVFAREGVTTLRFTVRPR